MDKGRDVLPNAHHTHDLKTAKIHEAIRSGKFDKASFLLARLSKVETQFYATEEKWALHHLPWNILKDNLTLDPLNALITQHVLAGWDVNATRDDVVEIKQGDWTTGGKERQWKRFTLLHLACVEKQHVIACHLVDLGANVNQLTGDETCCATRIYPLYISVSCHELATARYLLDHGSDSFLVAQLGKCTKHRNGADRYAEHTAIEAAPADFQAIILNKLDSTLGVSHMHFAARRGNSKLFINIWQRICSRVSLEENSLIQVNEERVPLLSLILEEKPSDMDSQDVILMQTLQTFGYNFNTASVEFDSHRLIFTLLQLWRKLGHTVRPLLDILFTFEGLELNVRNANGELPMDIVFDCWEKDMYVESLEMQLDFPYIVGFLLKHGSDVSRKIVSGKYRYYVGFDVALKALHAGGAIVQHDFFIESLANLETACNQRAPNFSEREKMEWYLKGYRQIFKKDSTIHNIDDDADSKNKEEEEKYFKETLKKADEAGREAALVGLPQNRKQAYQELLDLQKWTMNSKSSSEF